MATKLYRSQYGMAALTGILIVILVAAIAGVGWYVYTNNQTAKTEEGTAIQNAPVTKDEAPDIQRTSDLDDASRSLDKQEIDKNLDTAELDKDLNSLF